MIREGSMEESFFVIATGDVEVVVGGRIIGGEGRPAAGLRVVVERRVAERELDRFGQKSADNLVASIDRSRRRPLARILAALGIRHVGEQTAIDLAVWIARAWPPGADEGDAAWTTRVAAALAETDAEPLAPADGDQGLRQLETGVERVGPGVQETRESLHPVWRGDREQHHCYQRRREED